MKNIKGIIFDYGGTIDTNGVHWAEIIWEQYQNAACDISKELFRTAYVHGERTLAKNPIIEPTDTFATLLKKKTAIQFEYLKKEQNCNNLNSMMCKQIAEGCYNKVLDTLHTTRGILERLSEKYPMVLVTNFYGNMPTVLQEFGLHRYFSAIIESSVVKLRKPDPALFALGVKQLGMPSEEIVVIGDSYKKDIYPSSTLGCKTIWVKKICWEEESIQPEAEPTAIISSLEELATLL